MKGIVKRRKENCTSFRIAYTSRLKLKIFLSHHKSTKQYLNSN